MAFNKLLFAIATITIAACGTSKTIETEKTQPGEALISGNNEAQIIWVNSARINLNGTFLYQTQEGTMEPTRNWDEIYKEIQDFEFEAGYICQLEVKSEIKEGLPSLTLLQVLSKERDPAYFRIYDIWALTHMNGEVLDITSTRPNMEINLTTMQVMGKGMCNQYSGKIEQYTTKSIVFGPLAGTKMMCPEIETEQVFLKNLAATTAFKIKSMTLLLYNAANEEILRFQKVD